MSDVKSTPIESTTLSDGVTVKVNDHVYLAPEHLGEPYYVGRIMEFCTFDKRKGLQVRLAWFNRPKDVINKKSADPCLLVATMHSDISSVSSIRGKCTVIHKYYIPKDQLESYREKEDQFYYNQLYDRYIQRVYDVVPCETIQNVPTETLEALKQRYQFIVVEQGKASDLTVAKRICCVCQEWCPSAASIKCAGCQKSYHMACLNPPLTRKPPKGFAWQCAFCTRQEVLASSSKPDDSTVLDQKEAIKTNATRRQIRITQSTKSSPQPEQRQQSGTSESPTICKLQIGSSKRPKGNEIKMTNMWPFRYFGVNANMDDILDIDDRIYPRAKSKIGPRYQANVPDWPMVADRSLSPTSESNSLSSNKTKSKKNDKKGKQRTHSKRSETNSSDILPREGSGCESLEQLPMSSVRGGDDTVTCIYKPDVLSAEKVDDYMNKVKHTNNNTTLEPHSSDLMDRALYELSQCDHSPETALEKMSRLNQSDFEHKQEWTKKEMDAFEKSIREHGHELNYAKKSVGTKSMAEIVRYFYLWKKTDRYEPVYSEWTKIFKPMKKFKSSTQKKKSTKILKGALENDEVYDATIVPKSTYKDSAYQCMNCLTNESDIWRRSPSDTDKKRKVFHEVLCNDCGIFWLKYAKAKPISEAVKKANIQGSPIYHTQHGRATTVNNIVNTYSNDENMSSYTLNQPQKRKRTDSKIVIKKLKEETPPMSLNFVPEECKVCLKFEPENRLYTCYDCGISVHNDCYGVESADKEGWTCEPCSNKINPMASHTYECILCFKSSNEPKQPLKKTTGYSWAHVQCALFIPEIKFVYPNSLSLIENIGCINRARSDAKCKLCNNTNGHCVACAECKKPVHVQCAIDHKFKLAFEIQSLSITEAKANLPAVPAGLFHPLSPSGLMIPQVWCSAHSVSARKLIELSTRTLSTQESSLSTYAKTYKTITQGTTPAMRRFRQAAYHPYSAYNRHLKHHHDRHPKIPSAREAALEAFAMAEIPTLEPIKPTSTNLLARACATTDCSVKHTPIWWSVKGSPGKKVCQKCHDLKT